SLMRIILAMTGSRDAERKRSGARWIWDPAPNALRCAGAPRRGYPSFTVARLVQLHLEVPRHPEMRHQPVTVVLDRPGELDAARLQFRHGLLDVIAVERNVRRARRGAVFRVGGVAAQVGLGQVEDQPALADVRRPEAQLVAEEGAQRLRLRLVKHGV